jgi:hypothetical protein
VQCPRCGDETTVTCFQGDCSPGTLDLIEAPKLSDIGMTKGEMNAAIADAMLSGSPDPRKRSRCDAVGPGGGCARDFGHIEDEQSSRDRSIHWSWDTDHYESWPVGWRDDSYWLSEADEIIAALTAGEVTPELTKKIQQFQAKLVL